MRVGFIGTGSMGSILIDALVSSRALLPEQILVHNRTPAKARLLAARHPGITVAESNFALVRQSNVILLCVRPTEYQQALPQFTSALTEAHLLITITSPVRLHDLEKLVPCPVVRVVPSITNAAASGVTLVQFGSRTNEEIRQNVFSLFSRISIPLEIEETFLRISSDISSCGPAFISFILQQMIEAAEKETGLSREVAVNLTTQMIIGLAELLKQQVFTLPELQQRVCVPGGITGEGLIPLREGVPGLFNEVFRRTHAKFAEDQLALQPLFTKED